MYSRRSLVSTAVFVASLGISSLLAEDVTLLVVRDADYARRCTQCIPGRLYGVPPGTDVDGAPWLSWALEPIADTIELGYEENTPNRSSIPTGEYTAVIRTDPTKSWMKTVDGKVRPDMAWRLELENVPGGRTAIQFHYGKDVSWSAGCIILGRNAGGVCQDDCRFSDSPENSVARLREYVEDRIRSSSDTISVRIVDNPTVP